MPKRKHTSDPEPAVDAAAKGTMAPAARPSARVVKLPAPAPVAEDPPSSPSTNGSGSGSDSESEPDVSSADAEDDDGPDGSGSGDEDTYENIDVEFEFFDPKEDDFLGLKALMHTYLDGQAYDCSGLVDAMIKQTAVGTVVKTSEEDDPIALMTVLNTALRKDEAWMKDIRAFLLTHCPTTAQKQKLIEALDAFGTGLLLHERLINSPPSLGPPLMQFLVDEVQGVAGDDECTQAERDEFTLQRYVLCTRVYQEPGAGAATTSGGDGERSAADGGAAAGEAGPSGSGRKAGGDKGGGKKQKKGKKQAAGGQDAGGASQELVFVRPEDEFLHKHASWWFTFPVEGRPVSKGDLVPLRLVMCVDATKVPDARRELDEVVPNMRAGV